MASKCYCHFIFFLLLLSIYCINFSTSSFSNEQTNFKKWLSWNINNHKRMALLESKFASSKVVDYKLQKAEINNVIIIVNQNETGDFTTIGEAINSIAPYHTRRVIIMIKPGVYREKLIISKKNAFITFLGNSGDPAVITVMILFQCLEKMGGH